MKMKTATAIRSKKSTTRKKDPNHYPKGLNREKVQEIIDHYENQTDEEAIAEDEAAYRTTHSTMMEIPNELIPKVQKLIAKRAG